MAPGPSDPTLPPEQMFLENLPFIEKVVAHSVRRYRFTKEEEEDFCSLVKLKLIENDYEVFRSFRGECKLKTYLVVVIVRHLKDYANHLWGKWRPSAEAKRLGEKGVLLERLLFQRRLSLDEAREILKNQHGIEMSREEIADFAARLPPRLGRKQEGEDQLRDLPSGSHADDLAQHYEREAVRQRVLQALKRSLLKLPVEDRLIVRMRLEGASFQEIAGTLRIEVKLLYRRHDKALKTLRRLLEEEGIRSEDISGILGQDDGS